MNRAGWIVALVLAGVLLVGQCGEPAEVARAEAAEDSIARLAPVVDSLRTEALRRDTVLVTVTDTLTLTIERVRVEATVIVDSLHARLDSVETVYLDELVEAHAEEVAALEVIITETRLWGQSWKDAAEALEAENFQLRIRGDAWEAAYESQRGQNKWLRIGTGALTVGAYVLGRL